VAFGAPRFPFSGAALATGEGEGVALGVGGSLGFGVGVSLGSGVGDFIVGDRVFGATPLDRLGAYTQILAVSALIVGHAPMSIPLATAAAVPIAALTAWQALFLPDHADVQPGQIVLIHDGAGGTGSFAVQFARWRGAHVIATASGHNAAFVRSLGAHAVVDYRTARFEDVVGEVDAVIDLVGGNVQARSMPLIRKGGALASIVSLPDQELAARHGVRATFMIQNRNRRMLELIGQLIDNDNDEWHRLQKRHDVGTFFR